MEMDRSTLAIVAAGLSAASSVPYFVATVRGRVRPQRTSWLIFSAMATVTACAQGAQAADAGLWLSVGGASGYTAVFIVSLWRGVGGWSRADQLTLLASAASILILLSGRPLAATVAVIVTEVAAVGLTVRKARDAPHEESIGPWAIAAAAGAVALAATTRPDLREIGYPIHCAAVNLWVVGAVVMARHSQRRAASEPSTCLDGVQPSGLISS